MDQILMLRIRERAYHIWAANGGNADANWLRAETEILNTSAPQPAGAPACKKKATRRVQAEDAKRSVGC
jgi:Protein of unknown function (DUF2934)